MESIADGPRIETFDSELHVQITESSCQFSERSMAAAQGVSALGSLAAKSRRVSALVTYDSQNP